MKRYPFVVGATVAGLAGVLSFHSKGATGSFALGSTSGTGSTSGRGAASAPSGTATSKSATSKSATSSTSPSSTSPSSTSPSSTSPSSTSPSSTSPSSTSPSSTSPSSTSPSSATGRLEQYGYGQLSVRVTMSGGRITKTTVAKLQTADTYSQQLADQVIPILRREVLSAQSARINALSGATYTSEAYAYSVQSALDKLRK